MGRKNKLMQREIELNNTKICYNLEYKNVKNINLRIKPEGTIHVSANKRIPERDIDEFLISKAGFILNALDWSKRISEKPLTQYFSEEELRSFILMHCRRIYPYFKSFGIKYPEIKFRRMVSRWGSCQTVKGILTFNTALMYAPPECSEYVVAHEFTHFLHPDHSGHFYRELEKLIPDWKERRQKLKEIFIRQEDFK